MNRSLPYPYFSAKIADSKNPLRGKPTQPDGNKAVDADTDANAHTGADANINAFRLLSPVDAAWRIRDASPTAPFASRDLPGQPESNAIPPAASNCNGYDKRASVIRGRIRTQRRKPIRPAPPDQREALYRRKAISYLDRQSPTYDMQPPHLNTGQDGGPEHSEQPLLTFRKTTGVHLGVAGYSPSAKSNLRNARCDRVKPGST